MKPRLLLDCDGVVADFVGHSFKRLAERGGGSYDPSMLLSWNLQSLVSSKDHVHLQDLWAEPGFCSEIPCYEQSEGAHSLFEDFEVVFVTAPMRHSPTWVHEREAWILGHFPLSAGIIHTHDKHFVKGDVFVDDRVSNVQKWQESHPHGIGVVWARSYNASVNDLLRTSSWESLREIVVTSVWS